jgi:hypothetical protein
MMDEKERCERTIKLLQKMIAIAEVTDAKDMMMECVRIKLEYDRRMREMECSCR